MICDLLNGTPSEYVWLDVYYYIMTEKLIANSVNREMADGGLLWFIGKKKN